MHLLQSSNRVALSFCNRLGLLESIRRLNGILFPRLDEFRA
uniref:Uncharacterized protein n=1 Tax=Pseudomonas aeruginosa TaxID=287 RepID=A0A649Z3K8_PSEAI|nr:hypothetical protein [Pseudomonas aeruginosa]